MSDLSARSLARAIPRGRPGPPGAYLTPQWINDGTVVRFLNANGDQIGPASAVLQGPAGPIGDAQTFRTRVRAQQSSIHAGINLINVAAYADGYPVKPARYMRSWSEPQHLFKFQSQDRGLPDGSSDSLAGGWWEISERYSPHLCWAGYRPDNANDNTAAVNAAIGLGKLNSDIGAFTSIGVPVGRGLVGRTDPIVGNSISFVGEGAIGAAVMVGTDDAGMLTWGTTSTAIKGGGMLRVGLSGNYHAVQQLIKFVRGDEPQFTDCKLVDGVANLMTVGTTELFNGSPVGAYDVWWINLTGSVPNVAAPLFKLISGAGIFIHHPHVYNQSLSGYSVTGRDFLQCYTTWNTVLVTQPFVFLFDTAVTADVQAGHSFSDVKWEGGFCDQVGQGFVLVARAGGVVANVRILFAEVTGKKGAGIYINGAGSFLSIKLVGIDARECKTYGIMLAAPVVGGSVHDCQITQVQEPANLTAAVTGTTLNVSAIIPGAPGAIIMVGDLVKWSGGSDTIVALGTGVGGIGTYTLSNAHTVASQAMTAARANCAALYMVLGSSDFFVTNNSLGSASATLGLGTADYGLVIEGGDRFMISGNSAKGAIAHAAIGAMTNTINTANVGF